MKIIISIIIVIIVIALVAVLRDKPREATTTVETPTSTSTPAGPISLGTFKLADGAYSVNSADAKIKWTGRKVVLKNWIDTGTIAVANASFEVKDNAIVSNKVVVDMNSIAAVTTGGDIAKLGNLSGHLKSDDFFDVAQYPTSTFIAKSYAPGTTTGSVIVTGDLTIKATTKEIAIPVTFSTVNGAIIAKGSVDVDRTQWDVRYGSGSFFEDLGDKVIDDMFNLNFELKLNLAQ